MNELKIESGEKMITIIVPCFNEENALPYFYGKVCEVLNHMGEDYEIIFVNDGSTDKTLELIKMYASTNKKTIYISFSRNFGKEAAMYAGFCNAKGDYVTVMDADMQDPPELLPEMLRIIKEEGYDNVATRRVSRSGEPILRSWLARQFYKIINKISEADIVDGARDFRLMKKNMVDAIIEIEEYNRFSKGIFGWIGFKTYWMSFNNVERIAGKTKWDLCKLFKYAMDGVINFSQAPLTLVSYLGMGITGLSLIILLFLVARKLYFGDPVAGWASIVCIIIFLGGIQLFSMGIMGQYIAKTYMESKHRPHYIIAETNCNTALKVK